MHRRASKQNHLSHMCRHVRDEYRELADLHLLAKAQLCCQLCMLRRKVDRGLAKYRRGVAEAVLCKYRGLLSAKSPEKITPKAQVALATTKTSQLRSSRTSHRSTRNGNEVAGRLRIQFVSTALPCISSEYRRNVTIRPPCHNSSACMMRFIIMRADIFFL